MIVDVVKYLIFGTKEDLDRFFEEAQEKGILEFISMQPKKEMLFSPTVQQLVAALKILRHYNIKKQDFVEVKSALEIAERIIALKEALGKLEEEKRSLDGEIARVAPFGQFSLEDIAFIEKMGKRKVQFFCMKADKRHTVNTADGLLYIDTVYDLDYFLAITENGFHFPDMIEMRIDAALDDLQYRLQFVQADIERSESELKNYVIYTEFLQEALREELNHHYLTMAKKGVSYPLKDHLFVVEAWIPKLHEHALHSLVSNLSVHVEQIAIEPGDRIPTYLSNQGAGLIGEDLVNIYDIPAITDKDPSLWVLGFFALFFALIVADGGYGAIFLGLAFYLRWKFPKLKGQAKRLLKLFFILSSACIVWGILTSSYFGLKVAPGSFFSRIAPLHYLADRKANYHFTQQDDVYHAWIQRYPSLQTAHSGHEMISNAVMCKKEVNCYVMLEEFNSNILMEFMIITAIVHLSLGFLRYLKRNIAGMGWIAFMVGGYLYFPHVLNATTMANFLGIVSKTMAAAIGLQLIWGGIGFAMLTALLQKGLKGIGEIANLVQVFADVLSYLRLYALSLASSIMASTFNIEGQALGLVAGALVVLVGHGVNIVIALQGGVIHGLRLNFLEWYHYCFDGGGRLFKPLIKLKKED